jgi:hypothetical protein
MVAYDFKLLRLDLRRCERKIVLDIEDFLAPDTDDVMMRHGIRIEAFLKRVEIEFHDLTALS